MNNLKSVPQIAEPQLQSLFIGRVVVCLQNVGDHCDRLYPEELQLIQNAVKKRRKEFSTGRLCAHRALRQLNIESAPLLAGDKREPLWPEGVVGSISHSGTCCVAAVSCDTEIISLGLDVEKRETVKPAIRDLISLPEELEWLGSRKHDPIAWKLIFSAKESVYKCLYPVLRQWIGFSQARLKFDFQKQLFTVSLDKALEIPPGLFTRLQGRFLLTEDYIFTSVELLGPVNPNSKTAPEAIISRNKAH